MPLRVPGCLLIALFDMAMQPFGVGRMRIVGAARPQQRRVDGGFPGAAVAAVD